MEDKEKEIEKQKRKGIRYVKNEEQKTEITRKRKGESGDIGVCER